MNYCFYCDAAITEKSGVGDHMPIPQRHGGTHTVDCCATCHDMKDRVSVGDFSVEWFSKILSDFPKLGRESRITMARIMAMVCDMQAGK